MDFAIRLASPQVAATYPLPITGQANWTAKNPLAENHHWTCSIALPRIPAGHIIVPSYAQQAPAERAYRFTLYTTGGIFPLNPVPAAQAPAFSPRGPAQAQEPDEVSTHIDCWHTHKDLRGSRIEIHLISEQPGAQQLLTVSARPLTIVPDLNGLQDIVIQVPACFSQMQANKDIRSRICSPSALAMALSAYKPDISWNEAVKACYDPATQAYGAWPLAIRWATAQGIFAAVEALQDPADVMKVLTSGSPLVCSIRFAHDQLSGAPLAQTAGHLVVVHGIDGQSVIVKDPAAPNHNGVNRRYNLQAFVQTWLKWRGAAYIFSSPDPITV